MPRNRWPSVLAALAVLLTGVTNAHAHVHLCFDGKEPPASVHGVDGHGHHELEPDGDHDDLDVDLQDRALAKSFKPDLPALATSALCVLPLSRRSAITAVTAAGAGPPTVRPFSRPYLRAPPSNLA
jgi:hypothetical protein